MQTTRSATESATACATRCAPGFAIAGCELAFALLALLGSAKVLAQDLERGQARSADCVACHGPAGISSNPMFPHLAGQNSTYLELQLKKFQTGERYNPLMTPVAESLSPQDVQDLAVYFSSIGPLAIRR